ncbi:MAG: VWA domain-containing protein [Clostridiales Family XIII bacterium]|jgi:uncharacterized protein with von Willebrand factor type A (vWA) domain|nr:VWA domain-containing protein [Clostridiales Family XIII bacterium]
MFLSFFYLLRAKGLKVSMGEWMLLISALDAGLAGSGLTSFYYLCRSILLTSEADFDKFDLVFLEYFKGIEAPEDLPEEFWDWLNEDDEHFSAELSELQRLAGDQVALDELMRKFAERREEQKERHDGGSYWIGTGGRSMFGNSGANEQGGIRAGGQGRHRTALKVAGERNFRDFRQDNILDIRQFQMAFRKLRQFSARVDVEKTELDIDETIQKTSDNAGLLDLVFTKPRKNTVKLLVLFDSGGSMIPYAMLTSRLFQAVSTSNHFRDLKCYYFHNCIYDNLYTDPHVHYDRWVSTEWVLNNLDSSYKVIFVGDAMMSPSELIHVGGSNQYHLYNEIPGIEWLKRFKRHYPKCVWLNPVHANSWDGLYHFRTIGMVGDIFPMYELTLDGLEAAIKYLLVSR